MFMICLTHILHFVYKSLNCLFPPRYQDYFTVMEHKYSYYTRGSKQNLYVLRAVKTCRLNSLRIRAPKYWNKLPQSLEDSSSFGIFKCSLKEYLLNCYVYIAVELNCYYYCCSCNHLFLSCLC